jgi:hypothetical protein
MCSGIMRSGMVLTRRGVCDSTLQTMLAPHELTHLLGDTASTLVTAAPNDSTTQ